MSEAFQDWLNDQRSDYVLWNEPEMKAARIAFAGGLEIATTAERERWRPCLDALQWLVWLHSGVSKSASRSPDEWQGAIYSAQYVIKTIKEADDITAEPGRLDFSCDEEWEAYRKNRKADDE